MNSCCLSVSCAVATPKIRVQAKTKKEIDDTITVSLLVINV